MMSDCSNKRPCACTYPGCSRHGKCCECIAYHGKMGEVPGCLFTKSGEQKWDRSLEALVRDRSRK